jgi:signal transduction histidine kinase
LGRTDRFISKKSRMRELIESLLIYSRGFTQAATPVPVDLEELVQGMVHELEEPIREKGATLEVSGLPKIQADPIQMRQLFQNLIGNALKFQGERTPHIRVYGQPCRGGSCQIFVEDNGIGFDEKYLDQIFKPFQRLHAKSSPYKGSGMGLTISRKIVDRHNGTLTARSVSGEGSTFVLTLPLEQVDAPQQEMFAA